MAGRRPGLLGSVRRQQSGEKKTTNPAACSWRLYSLSHSFNHSSAAPSLVLTLSLPPTSSTSTTSTTSAPTLSGPAAERCLIWRAHNNSCSSPAFSHSRCTSGPSVQAPNQGSGPTQARGPDQCSGPGVQARTRVHAPGFRPQGSGPVHTNSGIFDTKLFWHLVTEKKSLFTPTV